MNLKQEGWEGLHNALRITANDDYFHMDLSTSVVGDGNVGYIFRTAKGAQTIDSLTIDSKGNVGIGTTNPQFTLHIEGASLLSGSSCNLGLPQFSLSPLKNSGKLLIGWNKSCDCETDFIANRGGGNIGGFTFYDYDNDDKLTSLFRILGNGNVGIGSDKPAAKLEVQGDIKYSVCARKSSSRI